MPPCNGADARPTRRRVLQSLAAAPLSALGGAGDESRPRSTRAREPPAQHPAGRRDDAAPSGARVATQNLGLGVSLVPLAFAETDDELRRLAGDLFETVRDSAVPDRMAAVAADVLAAAADVVAVQEAAAVTAGDAEGVDFLDELLVALAARGATYRVEAVETTTDAALPATVDGRETTVGLRDRDAVLVREGVAATGAWSGTFDAALEVPLASSSVDLLRVSRGYAGARVSPPDAPSFAAVSTHLERVDRSIRVAQARQLVAALGGRPGPALVGGDLNAAPGDGAYAELAAALSPVTADAGPTCCRASDLTGGDLTRTVDHVFARGLDAALVGRVGLDADARVPTDRGRLWPSDHAGVVVAVEGTAGETPAPRETTTGPSARSSATSRATTASPTSETSPSTTASEPTATERATTPVHTPSPPAETRTTSPATATARSTGTTTRPAATPGRSETTANSAPGFGVLAALAALVVALRRRTD